MQSVVDSLTTVMLLNCYLFCSLQLLQTRSNQASFHSHGTNSRTGFLNHKGRLISFSLPFSPAPTLDSSLAQPPFPRGLAITELLFQTTLLLSSLFMPSGHPLCSITLLRASPVRRARAEQTQGSCGAQQKSVRSLGNACALGIYVLGINELSVSCQ